MVTCCSSLETQVRARKTNNHSFICRSPNGGKYAEDSSFPFRGLHYFHVNALHKHLDQTKYTFSRVSCKLLDLRVLVASHHTCFEERRI